MQGPSAGDYYSSAVYYLQEGKDIEKAKTWINKAVDMTKDQPRFWYLRQQSLILAKAGDKKGAIKDNTYYNNDYEALSIFWYSI